MAVNLDLEPTPIVQVDDSREQRALAWIASVRPQADLEAAELDFTSRHLLDELEDRVRRGRHGVVATLASLEEIQTTYGAEHEGADIGPQLFAALKKAWYSPEFYR